MRALTRVVLAPAAVASVMLLLGRGRSYMPPPGDYAAQWLSNSEIALIGADDDYRYGVHVVDVDAEVPQERFIAQGRNLLVSPSKQLFAFSVDAPPDHSSVVVSAADGSHERTVFDGTAQPAGWLADSSKLILAVPDNLGFDSRFYSVRPDGSDLVEYPAGVRGVPSPDGSHFAYRPTRRRRRGSASSRRTARAPPGSTPIRQGATVTRSGRPTAASLAFWSRRAA